MTANAYIQALQMQAHPEGGFYAEVYRATGSIPATSLPAGFGGDRPFGTGIFYLLKAGDFSGFHRIQSDEGWHHYAGGPLYIHVLEENGTYRRLLLGPDLAAGQSLQLWVPARAWFAAEPVPGTDFVLTGCTVAPGFVYEDFELARAEVLAALYPEQTALVRRLCRQ